MIRQAIAVSSDHSASAGHGQASHACQLGIGSLI